MNPLHVYLVLSVLFTLFIFTIWSKADIWNIMMKFATLLLAVLGLYVNFRIYLFGG